MAQTYMSLRSLERKNRGFHLRPLNYLHRKEQSALYTRQRLRGELVCCTGVTTNLSLAKGERESRPANAPHGLDFYKGPPFPGPQASGTNAGSHYCVLSRTTSQVRDLSVLYSSIAFALRLIDDCTAGPSLPFTLWQRRHS